MVQRGTPRLQVQRRCEVLQSAAWVAQPLACRRSVEQSAAVLGIEAQRGVVVCQRCCVVALWVEPLSLGGIVAVTESDA